jgi:hypothetical protein
MNSRYILDILEKTSSYNNDYTCMDSFVAPVKLFQIILNVNIINVWLKLLAAIHLSANNLVALLLFLEKSKKL